MSHSTPTPAPDVAPDADEEGSVLRLTEFRALLGARLTNSFAMSAIATVVGFQVYEISHDPLALGWLGLVEAIPAISLALFGGHVADRRDRRSIILATSSTLVVAALLLSVISADAARYGLPAIFGVIFLVGVAGGFERPALTAFEAQVIPLRFAGTGASWASSVGLVGSIVGPAVGGIAIAVFGLSQTYLMLAVTLAISTGCVLLIARKPTPEPEAGEGIWQSLTAGLRYTFRHQVLVGAMALDLFAVFFGGAVALLPIFASDILHVGPAGLGVLRTAPAVGSLIVALVATRRPPMRRAGGTLLVCVAGFGVSMLVFALSTSFLLSLAALFVSGLTDGISMVIRSIIVRVASPEQMRGRIASVNWVFIGASNELGAFESGVAAKVLGVVPAVVAGALVTLGVVGIVAILAPDLRRLDLNREIAGPLPVPEPLGSL